MIFKKTESKWFVSFAVFRNSICVGFGNMDVSVMSKRDNKKTFTKLDKAVQEFVKKSGSDVAVILNYKLWK